MRWIITFLFSTSLSIGFTQNLDPSNLYPFEGNNADLASALHLGNGCFVARSPEGVNLLIIDETTWRLPDFLSFDEVEAAFWLDMTGDGEEDLILETGSISGRSSYGGGFREEMKFVTVIDVVHTRLLFSCDYFSRIENWSNDVDWNDETDDEPVINDSTLENYLSIYIPYYSKGRLMFLKQQESSTDELELMEGEDVYLYLWNGRSFQLETLLSTPNDRN